MITVLGLGPGDLSRVPGPVREMLLDESKTVVARTVDHPAASQLADLREVIFCDDIYEQNEVFGDVYQAIVTRVQDVDGDVIYAVPGSPMVGEFAVRLLVEAEPGTEVLPAESFVDAILSTVGYDPFDRGLQLLNGHELPDPLVLDKPTIIGHLDRPEILADVVDAVSRVTLDGQQVTLLAGVGSSHEVVEMSAVFDVAFEHAGVRTSLFIDPTPSGLVGAVHVMRRLREECPWDREQTHQSLVKNLVEETYELVDAIAAVESEEDWVGLSSVEEELGDVLLQVLFHAAIAAQSGAFDIDGVGSVLVEKLMRRHPHVFGDTEAATPDEVKANWDRIKASEKATSDEGALAGIPVGMPALHRAAKVQNKAAKVGFDWEDASQVLPKVAEELDEVTQALNGRGDVGSEMGDLMFAMVNLSRHIGVDPEVTLRQATTRFESRFRTMEREGPLKGLDLAELDERWERAKAAEL